MFEVCGICRKQKNDSLEGRFAEGKGSHIQVHLV